MSFARDRNHKHSIIRTYVSSLNLDSKADMSRYSTLGISGLRIIVNRIVLCMESLRLPCSSRSLQHLVPPAPPMNNFIFPSRLLSRKNNCVTTNRLFQRAPDKLRLRSLNIQPNILNRFDSTDKLSGKSIVPTAMRFLLIGRRLRYINNRSLCCRKIID